MVKLPAILVFVFTFAGLPEAASAFQLQRGLIPQSEGWDAITDAMYEADYYPDALVLSGQDNIAYIYDGGVGKVNYEEGSLLNGWSIKGYPTIVLAGERASAAEVLYGAGVYDTSYGNQYWPVTDPFVLKSGPGVVWNNRYQALTGKNEYGCLAKYPLRYGDIDGEGEELVLFVRNDLLLFNPELGRVVFRLNRFNYDELESDELNEIKDPLTKHRLSEEYQSMGDNAPQYVAASSMDKFVYEIFPAWRAFAKLYFGDFDGDGNPGLLMWRKLYESRITGDEKAGFFLKAEAVLHYEKVEGDYQLQETEGPIIESWVTEDALTWSMGWPSSSECEGQEEQLIPEMHDPLLNDPDVLQ